MAVSMLLLAFTLISLALILVYIWDLVFMHKEKFKLPFLVFLLALLFLAIRGAADYIAEAKGIVLPAIVNEGLVILSMLCIIIGFSKHLFDRRKKGKRGGK